MKQLKRGLRAILAVGAAAAVSFPTGADDRIEINHLGVNNTLVRVDGGKGYLLLPVQESNEDARINVLADGKIAETIYVRLAKSKTDYTVPFDLTPYAGKNVILDIVTPQGRGSVREAKEDVCWKGIQLADTFDTSDREAKYRPLYHHTPLYGWMNDPNGMFYKDGVWHLAFQWNPYGSKWQNLSWGQSTSRDLIHWETQPEAVLSPDGLGMIFSGSSAVDRTNSAGFGKDAIVAMYTSAATNQMQSLAWSNDGGYTYHKFQGNPTLTLESEARDPNMFWNEDKKEWVLLLAHALDHEMLIFTSPDMKEWTLQSSFGKGLGAQDGVWECPDLFELPVDGSDEKKWVLLCNLNPGGIFGGSATQYFVGDFDGKTFIPELDSNGKVATKWLDYGKDHYAAVSFSDAPDGRRTAIGWMSNWQYAAEVPTLQYRSANTLPREISLFRAADGELYAASAPSPELLALRGKAVAAISGKNLGSKPVTCRLPQDNSGACEIVMDLDAREASAVTLTLSNAASDKVVMRYDAKARTMSFDRTQSGVTDFSEDFHAVTVSPTFEADGKISLRIFVDRSSIELFGNGGRFVMTNLVFPTTPYTTLTLSAEGRGAKVSDLKVYSINMKN